MSGLYRGRTGNNQSGPEAKPPIPASVKQEIIQLKLAITTAQANSDMQRMNQEDGSVAHNSAYNLQSRLEELGRIYGHDKVRAIQ